MSTLVSAVGFGIVSASIIALAAVGFTLQIAVSKIFNLAVGAFMTVSEFVAYDVHAFFNVNIWLAMAVAAVAGAALGVLVQGLLFGPFLGRRGGALTLLTVSFGLAIILQFGVEAIAGTKSYSYDLHPSRSLRFLGLTLTTQQLGIVAIAVVAMLALHVLLKLTRLGKAMRATAADADLARVSGVNTSRVILVAWAVSGALLGVAGVVIAMNTVEFDPTTATGFLIVVVAAAVVGGIGEPYGAMVGALGVGLATEISAIWIPELKDVAAFALITIVLLVYPGGIAGRREERAI